MVGPPAVGSTPGLRLSAGPGSGRGGALSGSRAGGCGWVCPDGGSGGGRLFFPPQPASRPARASKISRCTGDRRERKGIILVSGPGPGPGPQPQPGPSLSRISSARESTRFPSSGEQGGIPFPSSPPRTARRKASISSRRGSPRTISTCR
jgi:hypothetical protein